MTHRQSFLLATCLAGLLSVQAFASPVINEIMYRPGTGYPENTGLEFIEIHNPDSEDVDLSGWAITTGADFTFPSGTILPAGGFASSASDPTALQSVAGIGGVFGPWASGATLANNGETITLVRTRWRWRLERRRRGGLRQRGRLGDPHARLDRRLDVGDRSRWRRKIPRAPQSSARLDQWPELGRLRCDGWFTRCRQLAPRDRYCAGDHQGKTRPRRADQQRSGDDLLHHRR